jgi:hypothetical protein
MKTLSCKSHLDMSCPLTDPLDELLADLRAVGFTDLVNPIDAAMGQSPLVTCTNCGDRGHFEAKGMKSETSYRAFWICETCAHWVEV